MYGCKKLQKHNEKENIAEEEIRNVRKCRKFIQSEAGDRSTCERHVTNNAETTGSRGVEKMKLRLYITSYPNAISG